MKRRFTINSLLVTMTIIGLLCGWGLDRYRLSREIKRLEADKSSTVMEYELELLRDEVAFLESQFGIQFDDILDELATSD